VTPQGRPAATTTAVAEVLDIEAQRCRAISERDWDALAGLLADELTHTHITGVTQDKPTYPQHVKKNPRRTEWRALLVRVYGNAAVVTGPQINVLEADGSTTEVAIESLQVWARNAGSWRLVAFASSGQRPR
jgi:ketosteroid isomerase-like protein